MSRLAEAETRLSTRIQNRLDASREVRPLPTIVARLMAACHDTNANAHTFASIIECDPALSARVLRLAASPLHGASGKVSGIAHAVAILGIRRLRSIALTVAGADIFTKSDAGGDHRQRLWSHSVGCAVVARSLTKCIPQFDGDEVFLAGMFHDIGKLLLYDVAPKEYLQLDANFSDELLLEEETRTLGTTHEKVGLESAHAWGLPKNIKAAIGWHHRPAEASVFGDVAEVIGVANSFARSWGIGSDAIENPNLPICVAARYGLTEEQIVAVASDAREAFHATMQDYSE